MKCKYIRKYIYSQRLCWGHSGLHVHWAALTLQTTHKRLKVIHASPTSRCSNAATFHTFHPQQWKLSRPPAGPSTCLRALVRRSTFILEIWLRMVRKGSAPQSRSSKSHRRSRRHLSNAHDTNLHFLLSSEWAAAVVVGGYRNGAG